MKVWRKTDGFLWGSGFCVWSFSLNAVFIFPVEPCLGWDGRPFIVQWKLIYTWKWKRASAVGCPGFFDGSALSLLGFRRAFRVVIHLHACGLCLLSPSPLLGPAFLLPLPPPSPVPYASREVYLLYLLAAATLGHPQGSEHGGTTAQSFMACLCSKPSLLERVSWERSCFLGSMPSPV